MEHNIPGISKTTHPIQKYQRKLVSMRRITRLGRLTDLYTVLAVDNATVIDSTPRVKHHQVGELVVFMEMDSFIPKDDRYQKYHHKITWNDEFNGEKGFRIRAIETFGVHSQGMIFLLADFPEIVKHLQDFRYKYGETEAIKKLLSMSFEDELGIKKWEYPTHEQPDSGIIGELSHLIQRPNLWRIQDIGTRVFHPDTMRKKRIYQVTEKPDGTTMHVYKVSNNSPHLLVYFPTLRPLPRPRPRGKGAEGGGDGDLDLPIPAPIPVPPSMQTPGPRGYRVGVCNKTHEFFDDGKNIYWQTAKARGGILEKIHEIPFRNIAVQGELVGSTIQGNRMNFPKEKHEFVVFAIWDMDAKDYLATKSVELLCKTLGIKHVPVIGYGPVTKWGGNVEAILKFADTLGPGKYGAINEGLVFRADDNWRAGFKVVSNRWLKIIKKEEEMAKEEVTQREK